MGQSQISQTSHQLKEIQPNSNECDQQIFKIYSQLKAHDQTSHTKYIEKLVQIIQKDKNQHQTSKHSLENNQSFLITLFEKQIQNLINTEELVCKTINQIMTTKKLHYIRQNFRKLILNILNLENISFYIYHESGRIQFQDFKENYITQILSNHQKAKQIQILLANSSQTIQRLKVEQISAKFSKLFELWDLNSISILNYQGQINKSNQNFSICLLYSHKQSNSNSQINKKITQKLIKISMIQTEEESQYNILQTYSKQLMDILQIIVNQSQSKISQTLKQKKLYDSFSDKDQDIQTIIKSIKIDQKCGLINNQNIMNKVHFYEDFKFELLQRIRMYSKYICEGECVFMDFNQHGLLNFIVNNFKNFDSMINFSQLFMSKSVVIQKIFPQNVALLNHLKKAMNGNIKNKKFYQVDKQTKVRIIKNQQNQIVRIHILMQQSSESINSFQSTNFQNSQVKKKSSNASDNDSVGKKLNEQEKILTKLEKQNPGIIEEGWLNLFIKDNDGNKIQNRKKSTFAKRGDFKQIKSSQILKNIEVEELKGIDINSTELNLLNFDNQVLEIFTKKVFTNLQYFQQQLINKDYFDNFLIDLNQGYQIHNNPFHNFTHGVNVMHTCYLISTIQQNQAFLSPLKVFSTVLSGLCHDVGHTGFTNSFQIASESKKALMYNDLSPLQNFHASFSFQIMRRQQNNFLQKLSTQQKNEIRKDIISNILYTDIKEHFPLLKKFKDVKVNNEKQLTKQEITLLTGMIIHTSDFGGSAKQFQICKQWSRRVNIQFSNQYLQQAKLGIPQTPFFKDLDNQRIMAKNEMGFLKVIVFPLFQAVDAFYGNEKLKRLRNFAQDNIKQWQKVYLKEQQKPIQKKAE